MYIYIDFSSLYRIHVHMQAIMLAYSVAHLPCLAITAVAAAAAAAVAPN